MGGADRDAVHAPWGHHQRRKYMGSLSAWHWVAVAMVVLLLFGGGGKISRIMGDCAKGIRDFRAGVKDELSGAE
jgi:sec-independent protein translocase protein TatA